MQNRSCVRGFTLIELLIVVAIIAILAAIAVPNFLEAQVRSKISRVKSDLRSIAVATEAYRVDNGLYPPTALHSQGGRPVTYPLNFVCGDGGGWLITTPVAYITSYPLDPFPDFQGWSATNPKGRPNRPYYYDCWEVLDTIANPNGSHSLFFNPSWTPGAGIPERALGLTWAAFSPGPTGRREVPYSEGDRFGWFNYQACPGFPSKLTHYDPTNGTLSVGAIVRYSGGEINRYYGDHETRYPPR
ncbi:prepilin-type N-terminal cleavage/methylation domain-containing protein [Candidatus Sumerlaeota bacterium]|nr:prepilin-type N-terminal cleavage/methylation domain-containing protein [Candidatus Sumerlaeota bacterium]